MNQKEFLACVLLAGVLVVGCGGGGTSVSGPSSIGGSSTNPIVTSTGAVVTQDRAVSAFTGITIGVPGRLVIDTGSVSSLTIIARQSVLSAIESEVRDGELVLGLAPNTDLRLNDVMEIEYRVTLGQLDRLDVNGTVHAVVRDVASSQLDVRVRGSSTVTASGTAERQNVVVLGTSRYESLGLRSRDVLVDVSGSAVALLNVRDTLSGQVTGAGVVRYSGDPTVSVALSGAGSVAPQ